MALPEPRKHYIRKLSRKYELFWLSGFKNIFKWLHPILTFFVIISPLKRTWCYNWTNLNPLYPMINCTKFDWIWPSCFWTRRFKKKLSVFLLFCYYLPLGKGVSLHLNKPEFPFPKDELCQVWLKLALWFWRRSRKCKSLQTDGRTGGRRATRKAHLSFQLRWATL
jgi:hypothetical protein